MTVRRPGKGEIYLLLGLWGLAALSGGLLAWQAADPRPLRVAGLSIDRLGAALSLLVAVVGAATYRFSLRYLDGEAGQAVFLRRLAFTVAAAYVLALAGSLLLLIAAWSAASVGLHLLLTHYQGRAEAHRPARKKFLISRLGDLALVSAAAVAWWHFGTLDIADLASRAAAMPGPAATALALLVVVAALTKSAQFPFHSWLPETMEAPTPVSALMHAGIINAGGVLLLRFAPLLAAVPEALLSLTAVGTLTACLGMTAMWAQVKVKRELAWSTVAQMGFMMVQLGLAAFPAALLHVLGHGFYKAWGFLRAGELPPPSALTPATPAAALVRAALGTLVALPVVAVACAGVGLDVLHAPGEMALACVLALSLGQMWVFLPRLLTSAMLTPVLALGACAVYRGAGLFFGPALGVTEAPAGPAAWAAAALPVAAFTALCVLHACLPALGRSEAGRAFHVHALHGFYFGAAADRLVETIWPFTPSRSVRHA